MIGNPIREKTGARLVDNFILISFKKMFDVLKRVEIGIEKGEKR
jgi:hypothetical protein